MSSPRVLLVDDNADLLDNLREILQGEGYAVLTAQDGAQALAAAAQGFEVALVDLRLPDLSGHELARRLKALAPEGEVVLLTGYATLETAIEAVRSGAFAYLVKPCAAGDLLLTLEQALRQVRLQAEKRELTRRAVVAEKLAAVGTMTAGLSHEIRNPLNAAALQLAVLERRLRRLPDPEQTELLEPLGLVRDEIKRLGRLLDDFLRFASPRELNRSRIDASQLIRAVCTLFAGEAERRGVSLAADGGEAVLSADPERLRQVLMNLALNALDATPRGGRVVLSVRAEGEELLLAVDDSGAGIPSELRARIFEPFFTTKDAGTGLGLPIVFSIVAQHGGSVGVDSSALGGARFWLRLPRGR